MRLLWALPVWLLMTAALVGPQAAYFASGRSFWLAVAAGVVPLILLGAIALHAAPTFKAAFVGLGVAAAITALTAFIGTADFQRAAMLTAGKSLDGVTLADAMRRGQEGTWVRLTDARVRSEATHTLHFTSGDARRNNQTHTSNTLAPITLASDVPQEDPFQRTKPGGAVRMWACAPDLWAIKAWDTERQAVRGTMTRVEEHVVASLQRELRPAVSAPPAGAGAMPAAPGFTPRAPPSAPRGPPPLSIPSDSWCIELDRALDAKTAAAKAQETALAFLVTLPFLSMLALMFAVAIASPKR